MLGEFGLSMSTICERFANLDNLFSGQFCRMDSFAFGRSASSLIYHILRIIRFCSGKQMVRIYTGAYVAFVQCKHAVGQWSVMQFVAKTMSAHFLVPDAKLPITALISGACPQPAFIGFTLGDLGPKSFFDRIAFALMTLDISKMLAFYNAAFCFALFGKISFLTTATHAQSAGIWRRYSRMTMTGVASNITCVFAFFATKLGVILGDNCGFLSTSAMAVSVRDFLRGLIRGMLTHVNSSFQLLTMPRAVVAAPWLFYWRTTGVIIAQMCQE